jgi:RNA polymerase sigma-70 factor, ECF subfamily
MSRATATSRARQPKEERVELDLPSNIRRLRVKASAEPATAIPVRPASSLESPLIDFSKWLAERTATLTAETEPTDEARVQETTEAPSGAETTEPTQAQIDEAKLVDQAIAGDRSAFTALYDEHYEQIYRYVLYRVTSAEDAEDLTQMVFLQAWRAIGRYKVTGSPFVAWLFTIAHNLVVSFYRRNRTTVPLDQEIEEVRRTSHPEFAAETVLDQERTRTAISQLRPDHQKVINLRFIENLAHRQIAESMGKTEGAVRVIQHRALVELRRILEREEAA